MGAQVRTGLEKPVVEVEVQVMGLNIVHDEHGRNGPGEVSERVEDILRLRGDAGRRREDAADRFDSGRGIGLMLPIRVRARLTGVGARVPEVPS
jgi:hypothetical protein